MKYVITCPSCGCEYVPSEIYLPDVFLGKLKDVEKDINGKILYQENGDMNTEETYVCDKCKKPFKVIAKVSFQTFSEQRYDFTHDYTTTLKKTPLFMKED